jgi:hypothetical protein
MRDSGEICGSAAAFAAHREQEHTSREKNELIRWWRREKRKKKFDRNLVQKKKINGIEQLTREQQIFSLLRKG